MLAPLPMDKLEPPGVQLKCQACCRPPEFCSHKEHSPCSLPIGHAADHLEGKLPSAWERTLDLEPEDLSSHSDPGHVT